MVIDGVKVINFSRILYKKNKKGGWNDKIYDMVIILF